MTQFNKGPVYGLTAELRNKIALKYDSQKEEELRVWVEEVTGMPIGENFQKGLKDGVILCELINKLQPGSVKKIHHSQLNWHKLENLGNFIRSIIQFGVRPHDIFEANDLFESGNMTQVQSTLLALASMAKTRGSDSSTDIGVRYSDRRTRHFDQEKLRSGQCVIGLQMGTNKCASQSGMTAYGTRRHLYDPRAPTAPPCDQTTISLQMGTNKGASQAGMSAPGTRRGVFDQKVALPPLDSSTISLQMGTNKLASQRGMSVYGLGRQVYDPKYCTSPTASPAASPTASPASASSPASPLPPAAPHHGNGSLGNGSDVSDRDYQAEYRGRHDNGPEEEEEEDEDEEGGYQKYPQYRGRYGDEGRGLHY